MKYLVTGKEMKLLDQNTTTQYHVPSLVLMEQAALVFVRELLSLQKKIKKLIVFAGTGNNGGDGLAIARLLSEEGFDVDIYVIKNPNQKEQKFSEAFLTQQSICKAYGIPFLESFDGLKNSDYDVIIDAIFGTGISRTLDSYYCDIMNDINGMNGWKIAVDIPSGVNSDNGQICGEAIRCDATVTFSYEKLGQKLWPGNEYCGKVICARIGIGPKSWLTKKPSFAYLEPEDLASFLSRKSHSNKGTYGKLLIIAGSENMAGAAILSAKAAYRCGVGLVKVLTREENRAIIQTAIPEAILACYGKKLDTALVIEELKWADAIVLGPGISKDATAKALVDLVFMNASVPIVVDADALNIISENTKRLLLPHTDMIVTPHLGEMARLTESSVSWIQNHLLDTAIDFARQYNVICVLKDFHTVIANAYGMSYLNLSGNSGLATAGSGDVLAGMIGAFLAEGEDSMNAAAFASFIHGLAADAKKEYTGMHGMMATDLIDGLNHIWSRVDCNEK